MEDEATWFFFGFIAATIIIMILAATLFKPAICG
jgi:hypothetical protein